MLTKTDLAAAARLNDGAVERGVAVPALMMTLGIDPAGAVYVANQRALKVAMVHSGWTPAQLQEMAHAGHPQPVDLPDSQRDMLPVYAACITDGLVMGVRAADEAYKP